MLVLTTAQTALAHKAVVAAYLTGGRLQGEGAYNDGSVAQGANITVLAADGRVLAETKTDNEGYFDIPAPSGGFPWKIVLSDGAGHRAEFELEAEAEAATAGPAQAPAAADQPAGQSVSLDRAQMEAAMAAVLDRRLAPIKAQLARLASEQPGRLSQIVGGIGWILGLVGVAAFFQARRRRG